MGEYLVIDSGRQQVVDEMMKLKKKSKLVISMYHLSTEIGLVLNPCVDS